MQFLGITWAYSQLKVIPRARTKSRGNDTCGMKRMSAFSRFPHLLAFFAYNALKWDYTVLSIPCSSGETQTLAHTRLPFYFARVLYYHFACVSFIRTVIALYLSVIFICNSTNKECTAISLVVKRYLFKICCNL